MVTVTVRHPENFVSETTRAPRGRFRIEDLPPGPAAVLARSAGFAPSIGSIVVEGGKEREARIGLLLEAQAAGRVVDAAGDPVAGAFVKARYVRLPGGRRLESFVGGHPYTASDGGFSLDGLAPDTPIALHAEIDGRRSAETTITVSPGMRQTGIVIAVP